MLFFPTLGSLEVTTALALMVLAEKQELFTDFRQ